MPRVDGPFKVLEKINDNVYKLELPADFGMVSPTFDMADLKPYISEEDEIASRLTSIQEGEHDEDIPSIDTPVVPTTIQIQGPITQMCLLLLGMMDLAWTRGISIRAWSWMEMAPSL
jgi:hypothetical protein